MLLRVVGFAFFAVSSQFLVGSRAAPSNGGGGAGDEGAESFCQGSLCQASEVFQFFRAAQAIQEVGVCCLTSVKFFSPSPVVLPPRMLKMGINRFLNGSYFEEIYGADALRSSDKTIVLPKPVNFSLFCSTL